MLAHAAALLAPRPDQPPPDADPGLVVAGELDRASGLGEGARLMLAGLAELGLPSWPIRAGLRVPGDTADMAMPDAGPPPPRVPLVLHVNAPHVPAALLGLSRRTVRGRRVIGMWAWELPVAPPGWAVGARFVHEVWAPSRFTAAALEPLLPGRVRVVPYCVASQPLRPAALDRAAFGLPNHAVVVLCSFSLASSFERKNPLAAIRAFRQAFGASADRLLVMKVSAGSHWPADLQRLRNAIDGAANIRVETRTLPPADNHALLACADIVLSLHRSEGFGLVPAEAMLLGRPVVATNWSGNTDFMDAETAALVPYRLVPAIDPRGVFQAPGAVWAEADVGAAAAHLQFLAGSSEARLALGARAQAAARQRLGPAALAGALAALNR